MRQVVRRVVADCVAGASDAFSTGTKDALIFEVSE